MSAHFATYRLLVCDLRTDRVLERLPVDGLAFDDFIGKTGSCAGTVPVPDEATARRVRAALIPGRTAIYVERGRDIWWGGIVWTATPTISERGFATVAFQAATFDSYLAHRLLMDTFEAQQVDQLDMVRQLLDYAQGTEGGDLGIVYEPTTSGVLRDRTYSRYDLPTVRELIDNLSQVQDGFEWRIRAYREADGRRIRQLQLGYPRIIAAANDVMLSAPGNVVAYQWPQDATKRANWWQSRGASVNQNQAQESVPLMSSRWFYTGATGEGWPRLDGTSSYHSVTDLTTLNDHAAADMVRAWTEHELPSVRVRMDGTIAPNLLGAPVRLRLHDLWNPDGHSARYRVTGIRVDPPSRGQAETAELYLDNLEDEGEAA